MTSTPLRQDGPCEPSDRRRVRPVRLPSRARRAVHAVEVAYLRGTDADYATALGRLEEVAVALEPAQREALNDVLARTRERVAEAERLATLRAALAGRWEVVRPLPGYVELVRLVAGGEQMLATVPAPAAGDTPATVKLVEEARAALRAGRCPRCRAGLEASFEGQALLAHAPTCRLAEAAIARSRNR